MPESFSKKIERAFASSGQLCAGIDPHSSLLEENDYTVSLEGLDHFCSTLLESVVGNVGIVKYQVSFFEKFGPEGMKVLQNQLSLAKKAGLLVIADAKRGDIGSTMQAYSDAWLAQDAPYMCDALTVSPFLGVGSLEPAVVSAVERGKGLFVLCATSNPEAALLQSAETSNGSVSAQIADEVKSLNHISAQSKDLFGSIGLVIGATVNLGARGLGDLNSGQTNLRSPILAPGFGAQGGSLSQAKQIFGDNAGDVIYSVSRSILRNGIQNVGKTLIADTNELAESLAR